MAIDQMRRDTREGRTKGHLRLHTDMTRWSIMLMLVMLANIGGPEALRNATMSLILDVLWVCLQDIQVEI